MYTLFDIRIDCFDQGHRFGGHDRPVLRQGYIWLLSLLFVVLLGSDGKRGIGYCMASLASLARYIVHRFLGLFVTLSTLF